MAHPEVGWVVWLQSGSWFVDVRSGGAVPVTSVPVAFSGPSAFAGVAEWSAPRMRWVRHLDSDPDGPEDVAVLAWDGPVLVETGDGYEERWEELGPGPVVVEEASGGLVTVRAGRWRASVRSGPPVTGVLEQADGEGWRTVASV